MGTGDFGLIEGNVHEQGSPPIPLLAPRNPPKTFGFGPIRANAAGLVVTPMASFQARDRLTRWIGSLFHGHPIRSAATFFDVQFGDPKKRARTPPDTAVESRPY